VQHRFHHGRVELPPTPVARQQAHVRQHARVGFAEHLERPALLRDDPLGPAERERHPLVAQLVAGLDVHHRHQPAFPHHHEVRDVATQPPTHPCHELERL
jgi:hypothetical protein